MNLNNRTILESQVVAIQNRDWTSTQLAADFYLEERQAFRGTISRSGYNFTPIEGYNQIPDIKRIFWRNNTFREFCGHPAAVETEITFSESCTAGDRKIYEEILTPRPIYEKRWVPLPDYHSVPLLKTAIDLEFHWGNVLKLSRAKSKAEQNLQDFMAMRHLTYDVRQYGC